jgi:hypothetical protein
MVIRDRTDIKIIMIAGGKSFWISVIPCKPESLTILLKVILITEPVLSVKFR